MTRHRHLLAFALAAALGACAATDARPPIQPGTVDAPPPAMAASGDSLLTETIWAWQGTQMKDGSRVAPDAPERYTLTFLPGGRANVRADCNRGSASYRLDGSQLAFGPVALTKMLCPPGSRDAEFLRGLAAVAAQGWTGNELTLTLGDGAVMRFTTNR